MAPLWGRTGDRRGHAYVLSLALLAVSLIMPWAAVAATAWHLMVVRFLMGGFTSALNPSTHSVAAHSVDESRTAGAFSMLSSAQMFGACVGPFASGPIASTLGLRALFPITGVLFFCACLTALRVRRLSAGFEDRTQRAE
jgi:DHA1 family multidrug resistance protein-like MFS transporter